MKYYFEIAATYICAASSFRVRISYPEPAPPRDERSGTGVGELARSRLEIDSGYVDTSSSLSC